MRDSGYYTVAPFGGPRAEDDVLVLSGIELRRMISITMRGLNTLQTDKGLNEVEFSLLNKLQFSIL